MKMNSFAAFARRSLLVGALCFASLSSAFAQAPLGFALTSTGAATPGGIVRYTGTFTNLLTGEGDNLYLADMFFGGDLLDDDSPFDIFDDAFFDNVPLFLTEDTDNLGEFFLTPGQSVMFEIFEVRITPGASVGTMGMGDVDFSGGGPGGQDAIIQDPVNFSLTVAPAVVPEAGSLALILPALGVLGVVLRKRVTN